MSGDAEGNGLVRVPETLLDRVVEAVVFAAEEPVSVGEIAQVFSEITGEDQPERGSVEASVERINQHYETTRRMFRIRSWAGGYRFSTVREMAPYLKAYREQDRARKLTQSLLETVAILAYRQPATRTDVETVRGVNCDYSLRRLLEFGLIDVIGRSDSIGRPLLYGTTDRFLDLFGLNAVTDLPNLREIEDILDDPSFHKERARLLMSSGLEELKKDQSEGTTDEEAEDDEAG